MISYRQADLIDKIQTRFRWIFDQNDDLDIFVVKETDTTVFAKGQWNEISCKKNSEFTKIYRRPGWVFCLLGNRSDASPYTENGGRKDIFLNGSFKGKIDSINSDGYVKVVLYTDGVAKNTIIDPARVVVTESNKQLIELSDI